MPQDRTTDPSADPVPLLSLLSQLRRSREELFAVAEAAKHVEREATDPHVQELGRLMRRAAYSLVSAIETAKAAPLARMPVARPKTVRSRLRAAWRALTD